MAQNTERKIREVSEAGREAEQRVEQLKAELKRRDEMVAAMTLRATELEERLTEKASSSVSGRAQGLQSLKHLL